MNIALASLLSVGPAAPVHPNGARALVGAVAAHHLVAQRLAAGRPLRLHPDLALAAGASRRVDVSRVGICHGLSALRGAPWRRLVVQRGQVDPVWQVDIQ